MAGMASLSRQATAAWHRRSQPVEEIEVIVREAANDNGAMRSMVENIAREPLNPIDQWRGIERLVALGWTEEAIGVALALPVRQIRKLRLLANVLGSMLDHMALGDMPNEQQLRTIAAASLEEQKEVWKANKPKKTERADWYNISRALSKTRMFAKDASFGDDLATAYGIEWVEDLFAPADQDSRYTTNVEAFLGAQQEWMTANLPKKGAIVDVNNWGQPELPKKAERVYGKPSKFDHVGMYLDRDGKVQSVAYRMPEERKTKGDGASGGSDEGAVIDAPKVRPDVTQKGQDMIGDFRTDALHEALARAPIEDDTLMALLVIAFAGLNVRVDSGASDTVVGPGRLRRHAARLLSDDGKLDMDMETVRVVARSVLIDVLSCRRGMSNSGVVSRVAGAAIGADSFLANMGLEDFLLCLSRQALEAASKDAGVTPRPKVRETRAALASHFSEERFVHGSALFSPEPKDIADFKKYADGFDQADTQEGGIADHVGHDGEHGVASEPGDGLVESGAEDGDTAEPGLDDPDLDDDEGASAIAAQ